MAMTNLLEQACNRFRQESRSRPPTKTSSRSRCSRRASLPLQATMARSKARRTAPASNWSHLATSTRATSRPALRSGCGSRAPNYEGKWTWGIWSSEIPLPTHVLAYLEQGATPQAPTLREVRQEDGSRVAILDLILEVPAKYVTPLEQEKRVLGIRLGGEVADHGFHPGKARCR